MNETKEKKRGLGALDVMIIILAVAVLAGAGLRWMNSRREAASEKAELGNYTVTFIVRGIRDSSAQNYLKAGMNFYLDENGDIFGTLNENPSVDEASKYYEMPDGSIINVRTDVTGDQYRVDVMASVTAKGFKDEAGRFYLNGNKYLGMNREVSIHSKYVSYTVTITGVQSATQSVAAGQPESEKTE